MKVAVVGGGSTYTPELVSGLTRLDVDEFVLEDVDPDRRAVVGGMARRMLARQGFGGRLEVTADLDAAVADADYVLIQIRVGGQEARLHDEVGAVPSYYLRYFYAHDAVLREQLDGEPRAAVVQEIERSLLDLYRDPAVDQRPDLLMQRGGAYYSEAALGLISSLDRGDGAVHEVDVRNGEILPGLAPDDVVEVPARVGREGPEPLPQPQLAPELLGLVQHVAA